MSSSFLCLMASRSSLSSSLMPSAVASHMTLSKTCCSTNASWGTTEENGDSAADQPWVRRWALEEEMRRFGHETMPTGEQLVKALFAEDSIEWNRLTAFQDVSMRLIAERLLPEAIHGSVYVQGEAGRQILAPPALTHGRKHHLYCSPHNIGAAQVVLDLSKLLSEKRPRMSRLPGRTRSLQATESFAELDGCELMLLYLTSDTWTRVKHSAWLAHEVCEAMRLGVPLLLVHESPSAMDKSDANTRRACDFNDFWNEGWTPKHLLTGDANIYKKIAIALKPGDWRAAGLASVIRAMRESSGIERQPIFVDEPDPPAAASRSSTALKRWSSLRMVVRAPRGKVAVATAASSGRQGGNAIGQQSRAASRVPTMVPTSSTRPVEQVELPPSEHEGSRVEGESCATFSLLAV